MRVGTFFSGFILAGRTCLKKHLRETCNQLESKLREPEEPSPLRNITLIPYVAIIGILMNRHYQDATLDRRHSTGHPRCVLQKLISLMNDWMTIPFWLSVVLPCWAEDRRRLVSVPGWRHFLVMASTEAAPRS